MTGREAVERAQAYPEVFERVLAACCDTNSLGVDRFEHAARIVLLVQEFKEASR